MNNLFPLVPHIRICIYLVILVIQLCIYTQIQYILCFSSVQRILVGWRKEMGCFLALAVHYYYCISRKFCWHAIYSSSSDKITGIGTAAAYHSKKRSSISNHGTPWNMLGSVIKWTERQRQIVLVIEPRCVQSYIKQTNSFMTDKM